MCVGSCARSDLDTRFFGAGLVEAVIKELEFDRGLHLCLNHEIEVWLCRLDESG